MNPVSFIETKRDGLSNEPAQIREFVRLVTLGNLADYQISAWLMAVFFTGLSEEENRVFTEALSESGRKVKFPERFFAVDKHSTGGVGDKTTLVVVPLAAACGVPVAKLSGRGLGFTGGTIDKLESIPGFRSRLDMKSFMNQVEDIGCAVSGHSGELAPAEARFYELRDVTGTVPCIPLITSSIVSKKLAGGSSAFVFDVKCGNGAFMQDIASARILARQLVTLSSSLGRAAMALITDMSQPLGKWVGNSAEVMEAIEVLKGRGPSDTRILSIKLAGAMLFLGCKSDTPLHGEETAKKALDSGEGFAMFQKMVKAQGGDLDAFIDERSGPMRFAPSVHDVRVSEDGWINRCDAKTIGEVVRLLDGGRLTREQEIDKTVCCELLAKKGDRIARGDIVARLYCQKNDSRSEEALVRLSGAFCVGDKTQPGDIVIDTEGPVFPE
ncbi:MAG: thymidine phosphorylase [Thermovirgaceae bacterium]|nr:thymidine phosphorylase [Thermovirgaceae bacterium]